MGGSIAVTPLGWSAGVRGPEAGFRTAVIGVRQAPVPRARAMTPLAAAIEWCLRAQYGPTRVRYA